MMPEPCAFLQFNQISINLTIFFKVIVSDPTDLFTILELQNLSHDVPELCGIHRFPEFEAKKN